jgi:hypothetical protein
MRKRQAAITLSAIAILNLSSPPKAAAFDFAGLAGTAIGIFGDLGFIGEGLAQNLSFYTQLGQSLLQFIDTKSLDTLVNILPQVLGKFGGLGGLGGLGGIEGGLAECSENGGGDCGELIGEGGTLDWGKIATIVEEGIEAANAAEDSASAEAANSGQISSGAKDKRYRPLVTAQVRATKNTAWTQIQDEEFNVFTGKDGQKFIKEERDAIMKTVKKGIENTTAIAKMDNTQDVLKASAVNDTLSLTLQQRSLEEQLQTRIAIYKVNNTENKKLAIELERAWREEIQRSYDQQSADTQGQAYSDFISSAYTDPGQNQDQ